VVACGRASEFSREVHKWTVNLALAVWRLGCEIPHGCVTPCRPGFGGVWLPPTGMGGYGPAHLCKGV